MFARQQGVALVITLIMLAVITFMAVTFLAVSRREAGSVTVTRDQTTARLAADTGLERVKAELLAGILAANNAYNYDLLVSTNYLSTAGYINNASVQTIGIPNVTNVNYQYPNGTPVTGNDALQNIANLWYNARPPVFITNRAAANSTDFRFYLDLNRNRLYDTNGLLPVVGYDQTNPFYDTNGNRMPAIIPGSTLSNSFVGDPEWIGILERPNLPHSVTNRFIARYAYIVVPSGKTLDVNYVHNEAKLPSARQEGFFRNQGVGSWEMNLAGFLVDLNTNLWQSNPTFGLPYSYNVTLGQLSTGAAFDDALLLVNYRYNNNFPVYLRSVSSLFPQGVGMFGRDYVDGYTRGPLMTTYWGWNVSPDADVPLTARPWVGSDNYNHFFTTQEFFDRPRLAFGRSGLTFPDRLLIAGTNNPTGSLYGPSSYDRYTFYRLLEQLGTDSATEPPSKLNLNYVNVGGVPATNFVAWDDPRIANGDRSRDIPKFNVSGSVLFFTNAADRLLRQYTSEWREADTNLFWATFGVTDAFGVTNIPVWVSNRFVYTPSVQRLLQLAANIYDSMTNRTYGGATNLPTVFRPQFDRRRNGDVYIANFVEVNNYVAEVKPLRLVSLVDTNVAKNVQPNDLIFGVPLVIGAKKGLPNFNEFAMQTVFQATRKLEIRRGSLTAPQSQWRTNMMFLVGISNIIGAEAWNSYRASYTRPVDIYVTNYMSIRLTNDYGANVALTPTIGRYHQIPNPTNSVWFGFNANNPNASFVVPLKTNIVFLPDAAVLPAGGFTTNWNIAWDQSQTFRSPQWGLTVTNKLQFIVVDRNSGRLIDYVQLEGLNGARQLSEEIRDPDSVIGFGGSWSTNLLAGGTPQGIFNQIMVSLGVHGANLTEWKGYDLGSHSTLDFEIAYFRALYGLTAPQYPFLVNTSLWNQVPFSPTKRVSQYLTWQANDPLVHYTPGDLAYLAAAKTINENLRTPTVQAIKNIGFLNDRYQPWGENRIPNTDATKYSTAIKDAGVRQSDDWEFPTNKFPNIGWLGRVHRGTPWQTIYLKSADVLRTGGLSLWTNWTGNANVHFFNTNLVWDAYRTVPESDRLLLDLFTTAFNENATRGQLSVNQSGLAAWSALFSGLVALTNSSSDGQLNGLIPQAIFEPYPTTAQGLPLGIQPVGTDGPNSPLFRIVQDINNTRADTNRFPGGVFRHVGDILAVPSLTTNSPFLNRSTATQLQRGINDAVYEWLPQQVMSLLQVGEPRFVVYSYGQTLRPAPASIVRGGPFNLMCTNYQVTAEVATRAVVRMEGSPDPTKTNPNLPSNRQYPPRVVIEKFNLLPPD